MNVEREIAGFALPFTAGILITAYSGAIFCGNFMVIPVIAYSLIFCSTTNLIRKEFLANSDLMLRLFISAGAVGAGLLSGYTAQNCFSLHDNRLMTMAQLMGANIQSAIESIPFNSEQTGALIKALLTGDRASLSPHIRQIFRASGASHILALSGLHLGIIYGILVKSFSIFGNSQTMKALRAFIIICICGFYTMMTGAGDSLIRAFLFIILGEITKLTGRYHGLGQILLTSLIVQLTLFPKAVFSVGFQLSYAAMAGIAFIYPWLKGFWPEDKEAYWLGKPIKWIWNSSALSISCQLTTGPLAYLYFGSIPMNFILTNLLALPLAGLVIPASLATLGFSLLGHCPSIIISYTEFLVSALVWSLEVIASM